MSIVEIIFLALGLAMDAFAVAVCIGLANPGKGTEQRNPGHSPIGIVTLATGLYFGAFQAGMPVLGYVIGTWFAAWVAAYGDIIAFLLLGFLGVKMIWGSFKKDENSPSNASVSPAVMLPLALATSIDAMAVGVSLAFLYVNLFVAVAFIGSITFLVAMAGVRIGNTFGSRFKSKAELAGGVILILIGARLLLWG